MRYLWLIFVLMGCTSTKVRPTEFLYKESICYRSEDRKDNGFTCWSNQYEGNGHVPLLYGEGAIIKKIGEQSEGNGMAYALLEYTGEQCEVTSYFDQVVYTEKGAVVFYKKIGEFVCDLQPYMQGIKELK